MSIRNTRCALRRGYRLTIRSVNDGSGRDLFIGVALSRLYYGKLKRPVRFVSRNLGLGTTIRTGLGRGLIFESSPSHILGIYEWHVQREIAKRLKEGDLFFDVGAHHGFFCLLASRLVGPRGKVVAFEPLPKNVDILRSLVEQNGLSNVDIRSVAVSDVSGFVELQMAPFDTQPQIMITSGPGIRVPCERLESAVNQCCPALVLVDVEGSEMSVLEGSRRLLSAPSAPTWIIETHSAALRAQVTELLKDHQYEVQTLAPVVPRPRGSGITHLVASKPPQQG